MLLQSYFLCQNNTRFPRFPNTAGEQGTEGRGAAQAAGPQPWHVGQDTSNLLPSPAVAAWALPTNSDIQVRIEYSGVVTGFVIKKPPNHGIGHLIWVSCSGLEHLPCFSFTPQSQMKVKLQTIPSPNPKVVFHSSIYKIFVSLICFLPCVVPWSVPSWLPVPGLLQEKLVHTWCGLLRCESLPFVLWRSIFFFLKARLNATDTFNPS